MYILYKTFVYISPSNYSYFFHSQLPASYLNTTVNVASFLSIFSALLVLSALTFSKLLVW